MNEIVDYVREILEQGGNFWYEKAREYLVISTPEGKRKYIKLRDPELIKKLEQMKEEIKSKKKQEQTEEEQEESEAKTQKKIQRSMLSDLGLWTAVVTAKRPLLTEIINRVSWLQSAIMDIGLNTVLFTLTIGGGDLEREDLERILGEIRDRERFVSYIMDKLISIFIASKGHEEIEKLRARITALEMEKNLATMIIEKLKTQLALYKRAYDVAVATMPPDVLRHYTKKAMVLGLLHSQTEKEEIMGE